MNNISKESQVRHPDQTQLSNGFLKPSWKEVDLTSNKRKSYISSPILFIFHVL